MPCHHVAGAGFIGDGFCLPQATSAPPQPTGGITAPASPPPVDSALAEAYGFALFESQNDPDGRAGAYIERSTGDLVIAAVDSTTMANAVDKARNRVKDSTSKAKVKGRIVPLSDRQLARLMHEALTWRVPNATVLNTSIDFEKNRVVLGIAEQVDDVVTAAVAERFGSSVVVEGLQTPAVPQATYGDTSPFYGGAEVGFRGSVGGSSVARRCTEGFGWRAPNGLDTMVTAGHCLPVGTNIPYAFTNVNGWGYGVGTAGSTTVNTSGSYPYNGDFRGDVAFINVQSGKESSAYVNTTTNTVARVVGAPHPYAGMPFCLTGITTGRNCSFRITTVRASYSGLGFTFENVMASQGQGACTQGGNSGGPIYQDRSPGNIDAVGIHSGGGGGGGDDFGGATDPCINYDTSIHEVSRAFGGYLKGT